MARQGTEKRQRSCVIQARCLATQAEVIRQKADKAGVSVSSFLLKAALDVPAPPMRRKPTVDQQAAGRILAQLGKIGSNINQLAHYAHLGRFQSNTLEGALRDLAELRTACLHVLGHEPDEPADGEETQ